MSFAEILASLSSWFNSFYGQPPVVLRWSDGDKVGNCVSCGNPIFEQEEYYIKKLYKPFGNAFGYLVPWPTGNKKAKRTCDCFKAGVVK